MSAEDTIHVSKKNESKLLISCEPAIMYELADHFCFYVPGYQHMPMYRNKMWDGKIRIFDLRESTLPVGLFTYLIEFAHARGYQVAPHSSDYYSFPDESTAVSPEDIVEFIAEFMTITSGGKTITPHDYQIDAVVRGLSDQRKLLLSPTASGKSLIIYIMIRWFLLNVNGPIMIVVPTTNLVNQMYTDFADYSQFDENFDHEDLCHRIYSGHDKNTDKPVVITTWQSVYKLPPRWFQRFEMVIGDEAHTFKAKSLTTLMDKCTEAKYRIGTTGSLDGTKTHRMVLEGLFGPIYKVTTTRELIDNKQASELSIDMIILKYPDEDRYQVSAKRKNKERYSYQEEADFIAANDRRNKFIRNLALSMKGNTMVLFNLVKKHGIPLHELIEAGAEQGRNVYLIHGQVDTDDREYIRQIVEKEDDAIIVASLKTFSTGINIKNLHNVVFAWPTKAQIGIIQSIGRALRKAENGQAAKIYDIADDLHWKSRKNHTLNHAAERIKIYTAEKHHWSVYEVNLPSEEK